MLYPFSAYKKAIKVIDSCINPLQLEVARTYVNLFFQAHSEPTARYKATFRTVLTNDLVAKMYGRLIKKLYLKQLEFTE